MKYLTRRLCDRQTRFMTRIIRFHHRGALVLPTLLTTFFFCFLAFCFLLLFFLLSAPIPALFYSSCCFVVAAVICSLSACTCTSCVIGVLPHVGITVVGFTFHARSCFRILPHFRVTAVVCFTFSVRSYCFLGRRVCCALVSGTLASTFNLPTLSTWRITSFVFSVLQGLWSHIIRCHLYQVALGRTIRTDTGCTTDGIWLVQKNGIIWKQPVRTKEGCSSVGR